MLVGLIDLCYTAVAIPLLRVAAVVLSVASPRWRIWHAEQRQWRSQITNLPNGTRLWFHAASMGEFEQLVPIIDRLRSAIPDPIVVVTVTSVSGIEHARSTPGVDRALVLPPDARRIMRQLVRSISPAICVIDRYDLWRNMIVAVAQAGVPIVLVNATMPRSGSTPVIRSWVADTYRRLHTTWAVTQADARGLQALAPTMPVDVLPDTRMDRVQDRIAATAGRTEVLRSDKLTVVVGSSWPADERLWRQALTPAMNDRIRLIVVPHQPTEDTVARLADTFHAVRYSSLRSPTREHIVVDRMGILVECYGAANAAFIGGGFGAGVHSTTEPACYGIPLASGPSIERSADAASLRSVRLLTCIASVDELQEWLTTTVLDPAERERARQVSTEWVQPRMGSAHLLAVRLAELVNEKR